MRIALAIIVAAASPALAQPITSTETCEVKIVRAPDDVALDIEAWVRAEPRCNTSLELRVIPTDGGYYLFARRPDGRLHERLVPDGQSAGVLVASWMADDWVDAPPTPLPAPPRAAPVNPFAPGEVAVVAQAPHAPKPASNQWFSVSGMMRPQDGGGFGLRGEVDLLARGAWTVGFVGSMSSAAMQLTMPYEGGDGYLHSRDLKAMGYVARTSQFGAWGLRLGLGVGAIHSEVEAVYSPSMYDPWQMVDVSGWFATFEGSAMLSRNLGSNWALSVGSVVTRISQHWESTTHPATNEPQRGLMRADMELMLMAGVRHRL